MQTMKRILLTAALAAFPAWAGAQATPACASVPNPGTRQQLLDQVSAWRGLELPPGSEAAAQFGPKLDDLEQRLKAAGDDESAVAPLRREFHDWKVAVLKSSFRGGSKKKLGASFCEYVNDETRRATTVQSIAAALTTQGQVDIATQNQFARFNASASPFDGTSRTGRAPTGAPGDSSAVLAPAPLGPDDPARYNKVRAILISEGASRRIVDAAIREALRQHKDPLLVLAVINAESGFNPHAHSSVGARGLMQIMPDTGHGLGVRNASALYDVQTNLRAGISYLGSLWNKFADFSMNSLQAVDPFTRHDVKEVVAAYNAGPGAVDKYGGVPPYRETQRYVRNVLSYYEKLKSYLVA